MRSLSALILTGWLSWSESHQQSVCETGELPSVLLQWDSETGEIARVAPASGHAGHVHGGHGHHRHLEFEDYAEILEENKYQEPEENPGVRGLQADMWWKFFDRDYNAVDDDDTSNATTSPDDLFYARECTCFDTNQLLNITVYCPFDAVQCRQEFNQDNPLQVDFFCDYPPPLPQEVTAAKLVIYTGMVWLVALSLIIACTHRGRSAISYIPARVFCCWNKRYAQYLFEHHPDRARRMLETHLRVRQQHVERLTNQLLRLQQRQQVLTGNGSATAHVPNVEGSGTEVSKPSSLVLRTRIWRSEKTQDDSTSEDSVQEGNVCSNDTENPPIDDEDCPECIICMGPLEDGDRVGALLCQHEFHVDCLKQWLRRCNACPLCKQENIALPRYNENIDGTVLSSVSLPSEVNS